MALPIDDLPHPVPDIAKLRWKENWLFVIMAPDQNCYGLCHVNTEPGFDRARFTFNLVLDGQRYKYSNERPFRGIAAFDRTLTDGAVRIDFLEPGQRYRLIVQTDEIKADFEFSGTHPTFDFASCRAIAPHNVTFREQMTLGTNLPHDHHQQALTARGTVAASGAAERSITGLGYRDHSYCMRGDSLIARHSWCGLIFDGMVIGVKTSEMLNRQGVEAREGYVDDADGARVLTRIAVDVTHDAQAFSAVRFDLESVCGDSYLIEADLTKRLAVMPFTSEKHEGGGPVYEITEHLCPITDLRTGRAGLGHIELGLNSILKS